MKELPPSSLFSSDPDHGGSWSVCLVSCGLKMKIQEILELKAMVEAREKFSFTSSSSLSFSTNIWSSSQECEKISRRRWLWHISLRYLLFLLPFIIVATIAVCLFHSYEDWTFTLSSYYFITLGTISPPATSSFFSSSIFGWFFRFSK